MTDQNETARRVMDEDSVTLRLLAKDAEIERLREEVKETSAEEYWAKANEHWAKAKEYRDKGYEYWGEAEEHRVKSKEYWIKAEEAEKTEGRPKATKVANKGGEHLMAENERLREEIKDLQSVIRSYQAGFADEQ